MHVRNVMKLRVADLHTVPVAVFENLLPCAWRGKCVCNLLLGVWRYHIYYAISAFLQIMLNIGTNIS